MTTDSLAHLRLSRPGWRSVSGRAGILVLMILLTAGCGGLLDRGGDASTVVPATPTTERPTVMPIVTPTVVAPTAPATGTAAAGPAENPATYVVAEGDSLYAIALRFGVDLNALIELNGLSNPNDISVGQELRIPPRP